MSNQIKKMDSLTTINCFTSIIKVGMRITITVLKWELQRMIWILQIQMIGIKSTNKFKKKWKQLGLRNKFNQESLEIISRFLCI